MEQLENLIKALRKQCVWETRRELIDEHWGFIAIALITMSVIFISIVRELR